jgi:hypothetical protein
MLSRQSLRARSAAPIDFLYHGELRLILQLGNLSV